MGERKGLRFEKSGVLVNMKSTKPKITSPVQLKLLKTSRRFKNKKRIVIKTVFTFINAKTTTIAFYLVVVLDVLYKHLIFDSGTCLYGKRKI